MPSISENPKKTPVISIIDKVAEEQDIGYEKHHKVTSIGTNA